MRLSVTFSNPAPYDQFKSRVGVIEVSEQWDIQHVQEKFPNLEPVVSKRLGTALTQQRRYLKYREEHHSLLEEGLDSRNDHSSSRGRGTTIASSLPQELKDHCKAQSFTILEDCEDDHSVISATSYASSSMDPEELRVPPIPAEAVHGPFLCPYCHTLISIETGNDWKMRQDWK